MWWACLMTTVPVPCSRAMSLAARNRALGQPQTGQPLPVPQLAHGAPVFHHRIACRAQAAVGERLQVVRQQGHAVRAVPGAGRPRPVDAR